MHNPLRKRQPPYTMAEITEQIDNIKTLLDLRVKSSNYGKADEVKMLDTAIHSAQHVLEYMQTENEYWKSSK